MANIPFTHQTISNGVTQASAGTMQTVFDAIRMIVDKSGYRSTYVLDADTVSGYGIGVIATAIDSTSLGNVRKSGIYNCSSISLVNGSAMPAQVLHMEYGSGDFPRVQFAFGVTYGSVVTYNLPCFRYWYGGSWGTWNTIWNVGNDGNGGQPPAPKPQTSSGAGQWVLIDPGVNTAWDSPAGGTWAYFRMRMNSSTGAWVDGTWSATLVAGGTTGVIPAGGANTKNLGFAWRIAS